MPDMIQIDEAIKHLSYWVNDSMEKGYIIRSMPLNVDKLRLAIIALKSITELEELRRFRQAKTPILNDSGQYEFYECGSGCWNAVYESEEFCSRCGQAIDWRKK